MFSAEIIADSIDSRDIRITTMKVVFPRIVLAEFNTHRAFSRNSASSRAIPFKKMVKMVKETPFVPLKWQKDHKGMQGSDYLSEEGRISEVNMATSNWLSARDAAVKWAESLNSSENGYPPVTKQLCNRLLEPFMWHTVIVTATDWENFFSLRTDEAAEIHIQEIANLMLKAYNSSTPEYVPTGQYHLPFSKGLEGMSTKDKLKICTARCARISYETLGDNPKIDYEADIRLHDTLAASGHWSPFEHCARSFIGSSYNGNFRGWLQYRKLFPSENRSFDKVIKHKLKISKNQ